MVRSDVRSLSPSASARGLWLLFTPLVGRVKSLGEAEGRIISSVFLPSCTAATQLPGSTEFEKETHCTSEPQSRHQQPSPPQLTACRSLSKGHLLSSIPHGLPHLLSVWPLGSGPAGQATSSSGSFLIEASLALSTHFPYSFSSHTIN